MAIKCPKCHFDNPDTQSFCGECGTQLPPAEEISAPLTETLETPKEELTTGSTFAGRYQIIEELGKGGMGKVYKAQDTEIKEKVALKLIKPEIAADKNTIERFRNELKMARKIGHRNVCRMYHLGKEEGTRYITMEYVPGENLKSMIRMMGQLSTGKTLFIAKQVCEGLVEAHRLGVVHRDLKPQNVMIDREGNARIMDFGIARSLKAKGITDEGVIIGTPEYMSPEQVEGKEADQRSDIYSLGVILYEMVTGKVPFEGDTPLSIAVKHKSEAPREPRELNAQIPGDLSRAILRCMEKDKKKRFQKAEEILSELIKIEEGVPTTEKVIPEKKLTTEIISKISSRKAVFFGGAIVLLIVLIVAGISLLTGPPGKINSLAVLPMKNLSGIPAQEYFADGMTEELISNLSQIGALQRVISGTSVMQYKGTNKSLPEIARELNVDAVVEGSVLYSEKRVRITTKLVEARSDRTIWSKSYERNLSDVLALQSELAQAIAREIKIKVTPEEEERLERASLVNPEAYQLYLKGRFFWYKRTEEDLKKAIDYFERAVEKDPNYVLAYSGLADTYVILPYYSSFPPNEAFIKAKESALKALEIDDTFAEAHTSLAKVKADLGWDWIGAEQEYRNAIMLNPRYSISHHWYSNLLTYMARFDEALKEIKLALDLDPLSLIINRDLGELFFYSRQYDKAIEQYRKIIEIEPNFLFTHLDLGMSYLQKSMHKEALAEFQKEPSEIWTGITYALMGRRSEAQQIFNELIKRSKQAYISPYLLALFHFSLGEKDRGFEMLNKTYEERNSWLIYLKIEPLFDSVRSDPRFTALLKKIGLE